MSQRQHKKVRQSITIGSVIFVLLFGVNLFASEPVRDGRLYLGLLEDQGPHQVTESESDQRPSSYPTKLEELVFWMSEDDLNGDQPFLNLESSEWFERIKQIGVIRFERQTYRSPHFMDDFGYDMVRYTLHHPRQLTTVIMAFRMKTADGQLQLGGEDQRPLFLWIDRALEHDSEQREVIGYRDQTFEGREQMTAAEASEIFDEVTAPSFPVLVSESF